MPRQPDPQKVQARHALIVMHLDIARTAIRGAINRLHPEPRCLPLPDLALPTLVPGHPNTGEVSPTSEPELVEDPYQAIVNDIFLNLFTPDGIHRNRRWTADHPDGCSHMPHSSVRAVYELIYAWYGVIAEAGRYRDAESRRSSFEWRLGFVQYHLNALASLPARGSTLGAETPTAEAPGVAPSNETD
ncbi:hypothetical protein ACFOY4_01660 [Actinomadura syzygii]|uniref:Uncharacterized protein n=1 Tax=Actinomadura syzygii TaxID=1427538 RepID=A0A5D0TQH4_9ACTN|nr:hypothetical protein [Actinomadura syzygii]TYC08551.1 hypothetical protein FXF65_37280 [Actinomadura syzygii]